MPGKFQSILLTKDPGIIQRNISRICMKFDPYFNAKLGMLPFVNQIIEKKCENSYRFADFKTSISSKFVWVYHRECSSCVFQLDAQLDIEIFNEGFKPI